MSVYVDPYPGLTCECLHGWLVHAINETSHLRVHNAHCSDEIHLPLHRADLKTIQCTYSKCVPEACTCRTAWYTGVTGLRCEALTKLPRGVPHIRALLARGNNITELTSEDLPDSLMVCLIYFQSYLVQFRIVLCRVTGISEYLLIKKLWPYIYLIFSIGHADAGSK